MPLIQKQALYFTHHSHHAIKHTKENRANPAPITGCRLGVQEQGMKLRVSVQNNSKS